MGKQLSFSIARRVHAKQSRRVGAARISGRPRKQQKPTQLQLGESQPHQLPVQVITVFRYSRHTCQIRQTSVRVLLGSTPILQHVTCTDQNGCRQYLTHKTGTSPGTHISKGKPSERVSIFVWLIAISFI